MRQTIITPGPVFVKSKNDNRPKSKEKHRLKERSTAAGPKEKERGSIPREKMEEKRRVRLCDMREGDVGFVRALHTTGNMRRRFLDLGLTAGAPVRCVGQSPAGDPSAYLIRGAVIAIRHADGRTVETDITEHKQR